MHSAAQDSEPTLSSRESGVQASNSPLAQVFAKNRPEETPSAVQQHDYRLVRSKLRIAEDDDLWEEAAMQEAPACNVRL